NSEDETKETVADLKATPVINKEKGRSAEGDGSITNDKAKADLPAEEDKNTANKQQSGFVTPLFLYALLTLSTAANGCIAVFIFRHNRERIKLLKDKRFVEREDFQEELENFVTNVSKIGQELGKIKEFNQNAVKQTVEQTNRVLTEIANQSKGHGEGIDEMMESFLSLNKKIKEQDKEITRYKEGYDTQSIKSSLAGYIKVRDRLQNYADNEKTSADNLEKLLIIIESAIDNLGASEINVTIGDDFYSDKYVGLTDDPVIIGTSDPEKHHLIESIVKKGYEIIGPERNTTIRSAKLKIYKYEPQKN
ncbi:hypothetical protein N9892_01070, partial [bacterium]|nr:hypothetical protein [bacterium]